MAGEPRAIEGRTIDVLRRQLAEARAERDEAQAQQAALAEVLRAINASQGDFKSVFDLITERAMTMCDGDGADLIQFKDGFAISLAICNPMPGQVDYWKSPVDLREGLGDAIVRDPQTRHIADMAGTIYYKTRIPIVVASVEGAGIRTFLQVPLFGDSGLIGQFALYRRTVRPFSDKQIALVEAFANQAALAMENARLLVEQREALDRQTATTEVLEVINASPGELEPVFGAMLEKAMHLCEAAFGMFFRFDGGTNFELVAHRGVPPSVVEGGSRILSPPPDSGLGRMISGDPVAQIVDLPNTDLYRSGYLGTRLLVESGANTAIFVALRRDEALQGAIIMYRTEARAFSDKQVALLQNFAAQAVIAMENARLLTEQREALEQQTATADILRVISQSPTDVNPVLQAVATAAVRFCGAPDAVIILRDGEHWESRAHEGPLTNPVGRRHSLSRNSGPGRAIIDRQTMHFPDIAALDPVELAGEIRISQQLGFRAALIAPMLRDGQGVGAIGLRKSDVGAFSPRQIQLLETFAAQAVIALENTRLFTELRESLEQQTATAEILQAISRSPTDVQPVLDAVVKAAVRFCGALDAVIVLREGEQWTGAAHEGPLGISTGRMQPLNRATAPGRSMVDRRTIHYPDIGVLDPAEHGAEQANAARMGFSSVVAAPLLRDNESIGAIALRKREAEPFTPRQITLLESFTAQAVIALENVRLFTELKESLEQQTATTEVLQTINRSPGDLKPVFEAILDKAMTLCGAAFGLFNTFDGEHFHTAATKGVPDAYARFRVEHPPDYSPGTGPARLLAGEDIYHVVDMADSDLYRGGDPNRRSIVDLGGARSILNVALRRESQLLGMIAIYRQEVRPFNDKEIALLQSFAAQAVIAMENARLLGELRESLEQQTATADILRVISQSPTDVQPVLDVVVKAAQRFCGAGDVVISLRDGDELAIAAQDGPIAPPPPRRSLDRSTAQGRAVIDAATVHLPDIGQLDPAEWGSVIALSAHSGVRSSLAAPMLREGAAIGAIMLRRSEVSPFTDRQIALLEAFAAQAVIAIENVRLFTELKESLDQQTATADILRVISQSPTDVQPVLDAVASAAVRFCGAVDAAITLREDDETVIVAHGGPLAVSRRRSQLDTSYVRGRAILEGRTIHVPDLFATDEFPEGREQAREWGHRAVASAPLLREGEAIGCLSLQKPEPTPYTDRQIQLLEAFAAQAVIAIENTRLFTELKESLDYQTATSELLEVISRSATDIQPVFDTMLASAARLCGVQKGDVAIRQGDAFRHVAYLGANPEELEWLKSRVTMPGRGTSTARALLDRRIDHVLDQSLDPERVAPDAATAARTTLAVPLLRDGEPIGVISLLRDRVEAFTERQIGLIETFADQAVIAMENARLLGELRQRTDDLTESLDYQTATSEVLGVISRSPTTLQPVLEAMTAAAVRLCGVKTGGLSVRRGDRLEFVALVGQTPEFERWQASTPIPVARGVPLGDAILDKTPVQIIDVMETDAYKAGAEVERAVVDLGGHRTILHVPLLRDDEAIGMLTVSRGEPQAFTERQIGLIKTFADQAVIAMENARLLSELRERTDDLTESLEYQTATSEVLKVISRSTFELQLALDTLVSTAARLCETEMVLISRREGDHYRSAAAIGFTPEFQAFLQSHPLEPGRGSIVGRVALEKQVIQIEDVTVDPDYTLSEATSMSGQRSALGVPLLRENDLIGVIVLARRRVEPFTDRQIELMRTFADQAVIAMENTRLLGELRQRTDDLTESLEYQTATSELLEVISRSTSDIQPVLDTMLASAARLCGAYSGGVAIRRGDVFRHVATFGWSAEYDKVVRDLEFTPGRGTTTGRTLLEKTVVHIVNTAADSEYAVSEATRLGEAGTALGVPLMREGELIGVVALSRNRVEPFSDRQIALVKTFADQAVIAMENARLLGELRESLDRQTATAEVLQIINSSPGDVRPVFDVILAKAMTLCDAVFGTFATHDGERLHTVATHGVPEAFAHFRRTNPPDYGPGTGPGRLIAGEDCVHDLDAADSDAYRRGDPNRRAIVDLGGARTILNVALRKDGMLLGGISIYRQEVRPFSDSQIALLQGFASQAVIAMENARLLSELRESLEQQTATSDVLSTISRSSVDLPAVLNTLVETVGRLCRADQAYMFRRQDDLHHLVASHGVSPEMRDYMLANPFTPDRGNTSGRVLLERQTVHIPDVLADPEYSYSEGQKIGGFRTMLGIPLMREEAILGVFVVSRTRVEPFTDKEIALASGFADQAVIALENARLFEELTNRQAELRVTFDNMGDGVVMFDADLRLAAWNKNFQTLLDVPDDFLASRPGLEDYVRLLVTRGELGERDPDKEVARYRDRAARQWSAERTRPDGRVLEVRNNPVPGGGAVLIYSDVTKRKQAEAEIRAARDAAEAALEQQTATADILKVIASSPTDVQPVLDAVAKAAVRFCGAPDALVALRDGDESVAVAHEGILTASLGMRRPLTDGLIASLSIVEGRTLQIADVDAPDAETSPGILELARRHKWRAGVASPMMRDDKAIGCILLRKPEPGLLSPRQIDLLETFAAQAVIAIENVRLFTELRESLERLKAAQANLVQSEKMASLGQLTAGIAHEIKNPLNFVNNFAGLSVELLDELKEVAGPALDTLDEEKRAELDETMQLLVGNLQKIAEHGKRADGIVKSMLSHSRGGSGDWTPSDINALVEEALNLAYHGARAQDKEFNVTLERDFTKESKPIEVVPQDVTRVFLNLFGNGFYAANKRRAASKQVGFRPTIKVSTRDLGEVFEVRVRDNGIGIPPEVREKLFQPFFTTKPTGEGTGLGLSISYDIVTQQHGGTIEVESEPGNFTEFTVRLPRSRRVQQSERA